MTQPEFSRCFICRRVNIDCKFDWSDDEILHGLVGIVLKLDKYASLNFHCVNGIIVSLFGKLEIRSDHFVRVF
jgi:hypothetical protein